MDDIVFAKHVSFKAVIYTLKSYNDNILIYNNLNNILVVKYNNSNCYWVLHSMIMNNNQLQCLDINIEDRLITPVEI